MKKCKNLSNRKIVKQSNKLINAKYNLTELEQKIILLAIAQIDTICDNSFFRYSCTIKELESKFNVKIDNSYFREVCKNLRKKELSINTDNGWIETGWLSAIQYYEYEGRFDFEISPSLAPYLLKLKEKFSSYSLEYIFKFNGKYTIRFYQFLMQVKNQEKREVKFNIIELYELLQLPKTMRVFGQFKRNVLEPSIKEINKKTDIKAKFEPIKTGRKYTDLILSWSYKQTEQTQKARKKAKIKYTNKQLEKYKNIEFARNELYGVKFYICKNFTIAPEINKQRGDGDFYAYVKNGGFFYRSISEFEADVKLAKDNQHIKNNEPKDRSKEVAEAFAKINFKI